MSSLADMWSHGATAADMRNRPTSGRTAPTTVGRVRWMGPPGFLGGFSLNPGSPALWRRGSAPGRHPTKLDYGPNALGRKLH